jgi:glutathione S-transferase
VVLRYTVVEAPERRLAQAAADYKAFFAGRARTIESSLADGRDWLVAGRFTAADIVIGYAAFLATRVGAADTLGEATQAWLDRCMARPAFLRARERQQGELAS